MIERAARAVGIVVGAVFFGTREGLRKVGRLFTRGRS